MLRGVRVRRWGCQYQNVNIKDLAATDLDMVVVDSSLGQGPVSFQQVAELKAKPDGSRRVVLAYLSVGEAESYRDYWRSEWRADPPPWLGPENKNWPGSFSVKFWEETWEDILYRGEGSFLNRILDARFDGVFLDRVDGYGDWPDSLDAAKSAMVELVARLREFTRARDPEFVVIAQNAEHCIASSKYLASIDGVSKESLLYGLSEQNKPNAETDVAWSLHHLNTAKAAGLPIFAIEYVSDPEQKRLARDRLRSLGLVPFFGVRLLDRTPLD
jgi:cysteinyl-tRNA synthetase